LTQKKLMLYFLGHPIPYHKIAILGKCLLLPSAFLKKNVIFYSFIIY
jgi:hypothetical protein